MSTPDSPVRDAARYLRVLYRVELAHSMGNEDELISLLSGVDPIDVMGLAAVMETLSIVSGAEPQADPHQAPITSAASASTPPTSPPEELSAPVSVIHHASDNWSKRVPCD